MPVGHTTVYIDDDRHSPHLKPGESALVDTTDREIVFGEVYLIRQSRGAVIWQISKPSDFWFDATHSPDIAMLTPLNTPRRLPNGRPDLTGPLHLSDGPIDLSYLATKVIGRVVGVFAEPK
jgi:hypothetical protein